MKIYFVNNINNINNNNRNVIKVATNKKSCDINIKNHLDIISISTKIKTLLNYNNNLMKKVIFNLEKLDNSFVEAFIYRILQGNYYFDKYKKVKLERAVLYFYVPRMSCENILHDSYIFP